MRLNVLFGSKTLDAAPYNWDDLRSTRQRCVLLGAGMRREGEAPRRSGAGATNTCAFAGNGVVHFVLVLSMACLLRTAGKRERELVVPDDDPTRERFWEELRGALLRCNDADADAAAPPPALQG